jgi:hypothetical protein
MFKKVSTCSLQHIAAAVVSVGAPKMEKFFGAPKMEKEHEKASLGRANYGCHRSANDSER